MLSSHYPPSPMSAADNSSTRSVSVSLLVDHGGRSLAFLNSLSSISLTNSANDVKKHTHTHTHLHCYHSLESKATVAGRLLKNVPMWSEWRGNAPTLEMSAPIMILWFSWVGPGIAITLWLFIPVTKMHNERQSKLIHW